MAQEGHMSAIDAISIVACGITHNAGSYHLAKSGMRLVDTDPKLSSVQP